MRVKVCSPLGGHKQGDTGTASTSGHEHPEAAAGVEVEAGLVEVVSRMQQKRDYTIWAQSMLLNYLIGWKSDNWVASLGCGEPSQEPMGELKSVLGHSRVLSHRMLLLVRCVKVILLIR